VNVSEALSLALFVAIALGVWLGRRKGKARLAASISAARAEGHADAKAELSAQLTNVVQVVAGNDLPNETGRSSDQLVEALRSFSLDSLGVEAASLPRSDLAALARDDCGVSAERDLLALLSGVSSDARGGTRRIPGNGGVEPRSREHDGYRTLRPGGSGPDPEILGDGAP